jgi:D-alanyl-D-alanine endopeptidase (penicillin-binding protein 7)
MNRKAAELGMSHSHFVDSTGLSSGNVSTAQDLVKMVKAAYGYDLIREFTTTSAHQVESLPGRVLQYGNSNRLVRDSSWQIGLSKTGYIRQAGGCLVMQARVAARPVIIVLLDSADKQTRVADASRIRRWLENSSARLMHASVS